MAGKSIFFNSTDSDIICDYDSSVVPSTGVPKLKLFVVFIYAFLFLAIIFNFRVIYIVIRILLRQPNQIKNDGNRHAFIYVLSLSIVDALVLAHLPFVATDIVLSRWIFGDAVCKLYWLIEQVNRILSTFILTALSADRYLAICLPLRFHRWRSTIAATGVIAGCVLIAGGLLAPTFIYSHVVEWDVSNHTISKCMFAMEAPMMGRFLTYVFVCGYCIPLISMVFFYGCILRTLWRRNPSPTSSNDGYPENGNGTLFWTHAGRRRYRRAQHVTQRALVLVSFYFVCLTPYWLVQFYIQTALDDNEMRYADSMIIAIYAVHVLVYVNSACNPFLYALLNKELQRQHSSLHQSRDHRGTFTDQRELLLSCKSQPKNEILMSSTALNGNLLKEPKMFETSLNNNEPKMEFRKP